MFILTLISRVLQFYNQFELIIMHYLQGHFDSALGKVISQLVPDHKYMSVHDLFNPELFHQCLIITINNIPELSPYVQTLNLPTMLRQGDSGPQSGYIEQRMHNFGTICDIINDAFDGLNLPLAKMGKQALFRLVKHYDLDELQLLIEQLFQLMIRNREVIQFITTLGSEDQFSIKDFLQKAKSRQDIQLHEQSLKNEHQDQKNRLTQENQQLRSLLITKQNQLEQAQHQIHQLEDLVTELKELQLNKQTTIQGLKKRLLAYQQTDSLFQEKDEQIFRLNRQLGQLQVAHSLLSTQLKTEKEKLGTRVRQLEKINFQVQNKCEKLINSYQVLNRQRQDSDASNKRVTQNLKDRLKNLSDHANELQKQVLESKIARQLRQRQFNQLMSNFQSLKSQSSDIISRPRDPVLDKILMNSSSGHGKQFLRLEEQLNQVDKNKQYGFEQEIMMFDSGQDNLKKVQDIIAENARLKQKISSQENRGGGKQLRDENQRLKKRLAIMKKRNQDLQSQKREELQLLISAFDGMTRLNRQ